MRMRHLVLPLLVLAPVLLAQDTVGQELSPWQPGTLEIHQISTGEGNAGLYILPDGTTMLVDAGEVPNEEERPLDTPDRPNGSRPAGEWISRYVRHALRHDAQPTLDYVLLTHFHADHMGAPSEDSPMSESGAYQLTGLTYVGEGFEIRKLLDRGWPDYSYPAPLQDGPTTNYRAFVTWQVEHNGLKVERFAPGRNDQVVLLRDAEKYPNFEFRNIGVNGEIWTGVGTVTRQHFPLLDTLPEEDWPTENMCGTSFRLSYGKFDYFNGADISGIPRPGYPGWHDVETPVAKAVGPVDAALTDHHGMIDSMNEFLIATLRPSVWMVSVRGAPLPAPSVWLRLNSTRLYPGPREVFADDLHDAARAVIGVTATEELASHVGHIVVRVSPGGGEFRVITVDDSTESHRVLNVFGPYQSR